LQVVWTNSHGLFVIGPFMAGCYLAAALFRRFRGAEDGETVPAARLFALVTLATFVTPFGPEGWRYAFLLAREAGPAASEFFKSLAELAPTFSPRTMALPDFWAYGLVLLLACLTTVPLLARGKAHAGRVLIVVFLGVAAVSGRRNISLFVLAATPLIAENTGLLLPLLRLPAAAKAGATLLLLALTWFPLSGSYYRWLNYPLRFGLGASPTFFPSSLAEFVRRAGVRGQLYNGNYLGGFCLYHGIRPLVDGRWEVYDESTLKMVFAAPFDEVEWRRLIATYDVGGVLLLHDSPEARGLLPRLHGDPLWRLVYYDKAASFWMRTDRGSLPPAADVAALPAGAASPRRIEEYLALATFYRLTAVPQSSLRCLDATLALGEKRETVLEQLGRAQSDLGRSAEAEETFRTLLAEHKTNISALNELAFLAYGRGDLARAEAYLRRALAIRPQDADIRANYERIVGARGGGPSP
ncbi:MAG TPA: tetratricopeptide repeat protein, partial [Geobacteraceae bacterium]